jgi:hypothetical protein
MKEKKEKENKRLNKAAEHYFRVASSLGLELEMDLKTKVNILLNAGVKEMREMHEELDNIIEEDYSTVFDVLQIPVSKQQYSEFVTIMTKIRTGEFSEKNREKYEENVKQKMFDQCMREKFLDNVINAFDETIPVPEWTKNLSINLKAKDDDEFNAVMEKSVERNMRASEVHRKLITSYSMAFEYITECKYTAKEYKTMLDWKYYCGGIPSESSKPRLFDLFYKFMKAMRLGEDFGIQEFESLSREMGLEINTTEPMPLGEHFGWWDKETIFRYCPTVKEDYIEYLKEKRHKND